MNQVHFVEQIHPFSLHHNLKDTQTLICEQQNELGSSIWFKPILYTSIWVLESEHQKHNNPIQQYTRTLLDKTKDKNAYLGNAVRSKQSTTKDKKDEFVQQALQYTEKQSSDG
jgi:hypothetical protein